MVERRDVLKAALGALAAAVAPGDGKAQNDAAEPSAPFSREGLVARARELAKSPYSAPAAEPPEFLAALSRDQYEKIEMKPGALVWASENKGFAVEPLLRGWVYGTPVEVWTTEGGKATPIRFDQAKFSFNGLKTPEKLPDVGFSGFRVLTGQMGGEGREALAAAQFQGASFHRAKAPGQKKWGVAARGLSIRTADPQGEEFPVFRYFWIEKPALGDNSLVIHALLDSPSVVGAYRFTLRAAEATIIDTELTLFPRVELDHVGIASLAGASLFTALDRRRLDDVRCAASEMNGLQMLTGKDEWLWRPLSNRNSLQYSSFVDANPKGFGFLTRSRHIASYQDDKEHWEQRPSVWIEPLGEWGEGSIQLVEIPSESEFNQNIIAYWRPKQRLSNTKEANFAYRQFWCWEPPTRPPLAFVSDARSGRGSAPKHRRFIVVFSGDVIGDAARPTFKTALSASPGSATILYETRDPEAKTYRVVFELDPGGESYCELRLVLQAGDDPISETWLYRWTS
jgi:glucans biosynthesis protein